MTDTEIGNYINNRRGYLTQDEIHHILDVDRNPQIDHYEYAFHAYDVWTKNGGHFLFCKR